MIWKFVGVMLTLLIVLFSVGIVYQNIPGTPIEMKIEEINNESFPIINYEGTPVFLENLRFNHNDISYFINSSCSDVRRNAMIEAFDLFEWMVDNVRFHEVYSDADIDVECSDNFVGLGDGLFAAGEGGPVRIINMSRFKVIEKGRIFLYDDPRCDYPIVELHELWHVFGFDHSDNPMSIMYNTSRCEQRTTTDMIELVDDLYSIEALADVRISDLVAVKKGRYLDFNVTVLNEGLLDVSDVDLSIVVNGEVVDVLNFGRIDVGLGHVLRVENLRLSSRDFDFVDFYVDKENVIMELDEGNNFVRMTIEDL